TLSGLAFRRKRAGVEFSLNLDRGKEAEFQIVIAVGEETKSDAGGRPRRPAPGRSNLEIRQGLDQSAAKWIADFARVKSDSILLTQLMDRSLKDLRMLLSNRDGFGYFSAGTPWFATVFGRDSLLTSIEALPYHGETAADVLRLLSAHQSRRTNEWTDEQPGKILHELRRGELARVGAIPHSPYYGGIDTTLLYLILMARYLRWTGDRALFDQLRPNMEAALRWSLTDADSNGDGYIDYTTGSDGGLANKGWKDSGDAVVDKKGRFPPGPIALIEVQAYAYAAWSEIADIFEAEGETARARELRQRAAGMRQRLNKDYWVDSEGTFAFYIDGKGRRGDTVVSNAGHALWAGAAEPEKARLTAKRLMADDMFSGWGIRTLAEGEAAYNPVGYHLGSVWPHDNMMIAAGLRRYGLDAEALKVCEAMFQAGLYFDYHRLPELFCGFGRDRHSIPVHYPVACHPQAWAAGAVPYGLSICLGLEPDAARNRLRIVRPQLPSFARNVEIAGLRVGRGRVHFSVTRRDDGRCETRVIDDGGVTVEVG
ncbi:MAG: amylo-alpha-1,6-glucosidase, partial [Elusimicrobia bacterium]|nr:amylo-alpha-1,6-glucosidase [Elusimicrobiota bacterium]